MSETQSPGEHLCRYHNVVINCFILYNCDALWCNVFAGFQPCERFNKSTRRQTLPLKLSFSLFCPLIGSPLKPLAAATKPHAVHQLKLLHPNHSRRVCMCARSQSCVPVDKGGHDCCLFLRLRYMCVHILVHLCVDIQTWLFVCVCVCVWFVAAGVTEKGWPRRGTVFGMEQEMNGHKEREEMFSSLCIITFQRSYNHLWYKWHVLSLTVSTCVTVRGWKRKAACSRVCTFVLDCVVFVSFFSHANFVSYYWCAR